MKLSAAANTEIPALLVLENNGYEITSIDGSVWRAIKNKNEFVANSPLELLGLIELFNQRGDAWRAGDSDIERCLNKYSGLA
jgi:hypothetical protein